MEVSDEKVKGSADFSMNFLWESALPLFKIPFIWKAISPAICLNDA